MEQELTPEEQSKVDMIIDKLENGEASQLGDEEFSNKVWDEVNRIIKNDKHL